MLAAMTTDRHPPTRADGPVALAKLTKLTQIASGRMNIGRLSVKERFGFRTSPFVLSSVSRMSPGHPFILS